MAKKIKSATLNGQVYTIESIREKLSTNDKWLYRGMLAIYDYQTAEEQNIMVTHESNGVGFNHVDAEILSSFVKQLNNRGFLTANQIAIARRKMVKYAGQLLRIIEAKAA